MRRHARRDKNETIIVDALKGCGVQVFRVSGEGLPDLLLYRHGMWLPVEVKGPDGKLTPAQVETMAKAPFPVLRSIEDALAVLPLLRRVLA